EPYSGINVLTLLSSAMGAHYTAPIWVTFRQAIELGAHVRKDEKRSPVGYATSLSRTDTDEPTGAATQRCIPPPPPPTSCTVPQIDDLQGHFYGRAESTRNPDERIADAESFFAATRADIRHGGDCAYYSPPLDYIQMPDFTAFRDAQSYYATLAHEATH